MDYDMPPTATHYHIKPTYYAANGGTSTIDLFVIPRTAIPPLALHVTDLRAMKKLQLIPDRRYRCTGSTCSTCEVRQPRYHG